MDLTGDSPSAETSKYVDEDKLKQITGMGFSRSSAVKELEECAGNVQNAIISLLNKSSSA